ASDDPLHANPCPHPTGPGSPRYARITDNTFHTNMPDKDTNSHPSRPDAQTLPYLPDAQTLLHPSRPDTQTLPYLPDAQTILHTNSHTNMPESQTRGSSFSVTATDRGGGLFPPATHGPLHGD